MCLPSVLWVSWGSPPALPVPSSRAAVFSGSTAEGLVALCCSSPLHFQSLLCLSRAKFHLGGRPWEAEGFVSSRILRSSPSCLPQASGRCPCWVSVRSPFGHHQCGFCAPPPAPGLCTSFSICYRCCGQIERRPVQEAPSPGPLDPSVHQSPASQPIGLQRAPAEGCVLGRSLLQGRRSLPSGAFKAGWEPARFKRPIKCKANNNI